MSGRKPVPFFNRLLRIAPCRRDDDPRFVGERHWRLFLNRRATAGDRYGRASGVHPQGLVLASGGRSQNQRFAGRPRWNRYLLRIAELPRSSITSAVNYPGVRQGPPSVKPRETTPVEASHPGAQTGPEPWLAPPREEHLGVSRTTHNGGRAAVVGHAPLGSNRRRRIGGLRFAWRGPRRFWRRGRRRVSLRYAGWLGGLLHPTPRWRR